MNNAITKNSATLFKTNLLRLVNASRCTFNRPIREYTCSSAIKQESVKENIRQKSGMKYNQYISIFYNNINRYL
jgi:hypothetical protein